MGNDVVVWCRCGATHPVFFFATPPLFIDEIYTTQRSYLLMSVVLIFVVKLFCLGETEDVDLGINKKL